MRTHANSFWLVEPPPSLNEFSSEPLANTLSERGERAKSQMVTSRSDVPASGSESDGDCAVEIVHGEPLTDRKSTFQAHVASVHSVEEVGV